MKRCKSFSATACRLTAILCAALLIAGCGKSDPPAFRLNMLGMINNEIPDPIQQEVANILEAMFGTPDQPYVVPETGLDLKRIQAAAGNVWSDRGGKKYGLYREHCGHCHGITGDGYGPTAEFLNPYPRDYTKGKFKFKSTERSAAPTIADLLRILDDGVPGTAMPSFRLLPPDAKKALVEYVKYLSMRGEMETALIAHCADEGLEEGDHIDSSRGNLIDYMLIPIAEKWSQAESQVIHPDQQAAPIPGRSPQQVAASAAKGRDLFYGKRANCFTCHGDTALGDGQTTDYDDWSKAVKQFEDDHQEHDSRSLGLLPPRTARPRNLRKGVYRGGRRPLDLYWRIYAGINGTPMPATGPSAPGGKGVLSSEEIWQLVDYVHQLPFEPASLPPTEQPTMQLGRR